MVWLDSSRTESGNRGVRRRSLHERRWGAELHDFAAAWRSQPKWVVPRTLKSVGPSATLVEDDVETVIRGLKAQPVGEIEVAGPDLAGSLTKTCSKKSMAFRTENDSNQWWMLAARVSFRGANDLRF